MELTKIQETVVMNAAENILNAYKTGNTELIDGCIKRLLDFGVMLTGKHTYQLAPKVSEAVTRTIERRMSPQPAKVSLIYTVIGNYTVKQE